MKDKKKLIILSSIIIGVLAIVLGFTYALFTYDRAGTNQELVLGDIYFHYRETDRVINIQNAMPKKLIADDFVRTKYLNPKMESQNLSDTNELTTCVSFMEQANFWASPEYTNVDLCQGTGKINFDGQQLLTFDEVLMYASSVEGGPEMVQMLAAQNIVVEENGNYKLNPIVKTQEVNNLPLCVNTLETYISENSLVLESGETTEGFCRGTGTLEGMTYEEHKNANSELYEETIRWLIRSESVKTDNILSDIDLSYFEFRVEGKNTYTKKDIEYELVLNNSEYQGTDKGTRTERINDKFLKFALVEIDNNGLPILKFHNVSYEDLTNKSIFTNSISNTDGEIDRTYRLYMWIGDEVVIGGGDATYDYDMDTWNNKIYASIRIDINANFVPKNVSTDYEVAVDSASFKRLASNK